MGKMVFLVPQSRVNVDAARQAYLAAPDGTPWVTYSRLVGNHLVLERSFSDSAILHYPWQLPDGTWTTLCTATSPERAEPYDLGIELARGTLSALREFLWELSFVGVSLPAEIKTRMAEITREFSEVVILGGDPAARLFRLDKILVACLELGRHLVLRLSEELLAAKTRSTRRLPALLGVVLGNWLPEEVIGNLLAEAVNAAVIPISWRTVEVSELRWDWSLPDRQLEWCRKHSLKAVGGPLLAFSPRYFPDFLEAYAGDWEALQESCLYFVRTVVERYRGRMQLWLCGGRVNTGEVLILPEDERLELVAGAVSIIRELDPTTPVLLSIDQPFGEYLASRSGKYPPFHLAEALLRSNLALAGIHLEMALGYFPGSMRRDLIQLSRFLDLWSSLEVPLFITFVMPGGTEADPNAWLTGRMVQPGATAEKQASWTAELLQLTLAWPQVQGIFWGELSDHLPHEFPHGGLFKAPGVPKPVLSVLTRFRKSLLF
jgi:hypothetical protein